MAHIWHDFEIGDYVEYRGDTHFVVRIFSETVWLKSTTTERILKGVLADTGKITVLRATKWK